MLVYLISAAFAADLRLEDALERAIAQSEDVRAAEAGVRGAAATQTSALSGWLPQASGSVALQHTFASEYDDLFGDMGGATSPFADLPFGADNTWRMDLSVSQGIFQGGRVLATRRLAAAGRSLAEAQLQSARASAVLSAAQGYYDLLLARRMLAIAEGTLARAETTLAHAKLGNEVGRTPDFEVLRATVEVENQRVTVIDRQRLARLAEANLRRQLHLAPDEPLELSTPLGDEAPESVGPLAARVAGVSEAEGPRASVVQSEAALLSAEAAVGLTRSAALPALYASASYGLVQYPEGLAPDADWRTNASAGLALTVPLLAGGYVASELAAAKADAEAARQRLLLTRSYDELDRADALASLEAAEARWQATAGTVAQAEKAWTIAETRFQAGISTQSELSDARLLLEQAATNRASAARDLQVARVRVALLPALPLASSSSSGGSAAW